MEDWGNRKSRRYPKIWGARRPAVRNPHNLRDKLAADVERLASSEGRQGNDSGARAKGIGSVQRVRVWGGTDGPFAPPSVRAVLNNPDFFFFG